MSKILVIEDQAMIRENIIEILELAGFEAIGAEDGQAGLTLARQYRPDLILCDILMPVLDGFGVLEGLRSDPELAATPLIFLSAGTNEEGIRQGMALGANDYLTKPFVPADMVGVVRRWLEAKG